MKLVILVNLLQLVVISAKKVQKLNFYLIKGAYDYGAIDAKLIDSDLID